jgi:hypothetical protein
MPWIKIDESVPRRVRSFFAGGFDKVSVRVESHSPESLDVVFHLRRDDGERVRVRRGGGPQDVFFGDVGRAEGFADRWWESPELTRRVRAAGYRQSALPNVSLELVDLVPKLFDLLEHLHALVCEGEDLDLQDTRSHLRAELLGRYGDDSAAVTSNVGLDGSTRVCSAHDSSSSVGGGAPADAGAGCGDPDSTEGEPPSLAALADDLDRVVAGLRGLVAEQAWGSARGPKGGE